MNGGGGEVGGLGREVGGVGREWDLPSSIEDGLSLTPIRGSQSGLWTQRQQLIMLLVVHILHLHAHVNLYLTSNDFCLSTYILSILTRGSEYTITSSCQCYTAVQLVTVVCGTVVHSPLYLSLKSFKNLQLQIVCNSSQLASLASRATL